MPLSPRQRHCLSRMGVEVWVGAGTSEQGAGPSEQEAGTDRRPRGVAAWQTLQDEVRVCRLCPLHQSRTQAVFGTGNPEAEWLLVGEAPGAEEDRRGEPFVGQAGKLLDSMLLACGLERSEVFITNILKCRPPANRDPEPEEVAACSAYLARQIAWLGPRIILALGRVAARHLLQVDTPIGRLRGRAHRYREDIPLVVTWHPAYLLRQPGQKAKAWQDLQLAMSLMSHPTLSARTPEPREDRS